jgi:glutathione synthase/RimK-type ligase-like ATP-grasp enzyme
MGNNAIAAAIDSQRDGPTVDWRREGGRGIRNLQPYALEPELAARCVTLCKKLGLSFGAIDLIVGDDGEIYFLEVNPAGQFLWKEAVLPELPLLDTFCRYLVDPAYLISPQPEPLHFKDFA